MNSLINTFSTHTNLYTLHFNATFLHFTECFGSNTAILKSKAQQLILYSHINVLEQSLDMFMLTLFDFHRLMQRLRCFPAKFYIPIWLNIVMSAARLGLGFPAISAGEAFY